MRSADAQVNLYRTWILGGGGVFIAVTVFTLWYMTAGWGGGAAGGPGGSADVPATAKASPGTASMPSAAQSASRPAGVPATLQATRKWSPPRFTARQRERDAMVRVIRDWYNLTDQAVLGAMAAVARHEFVPEKLSANAYDDTPLPIGHGQTISQPYIVAEMTRQLKLRADSRVLEIGTGSGYQAAVLTEFTPNVCTIEIVKPLAEAAAQRLKRLGYDTVRVRTGDGYYGWEEEAPFDAIIVTCSAGQIPPPLIKQLAPGGLMVIPVGSAFATQSLMLIEKDKEGTVRSRSLMAVRFVPLLRKDVSAQ